MRWHAGSAARGDDWASRSGPLDALASRRPGRPTLHIVDLAPAPVRTSLPDGAPAAAAAVAAGGSQPRSAVDCRPTAVWAGTRLWLYANAGRIRGGGDGVDCRVRLGRWISTCRSIPRCSGSASGHGVGDARSGLGRVAAGWRRAAAKRGRRRCSPSPTTADRLLLPSRRTIWSRDLLNAHQLRDKGLGGPATGPAAHATRRSRVRRGRIRRA